MAIKRFCLTLYCILFYILMSFFLFNCAVEKTTGEPLVSVDSTKLLIERAKTYLGTKYEWGKWDCSKFTQTTYEPFRWIPRNSFKQYIMYQTSNDSLIRRLVFFKGENTTKPVDHAGIRINSEHFIHNSSSKGVIISDFENPYWKKIRITE